MDQKNGRSQKIPKSKISAFSCLSTTRRNFWNSFILRPYFQSCFPKLQMAHTVPFLQFFCRKLAQWLLRTYYILKWVSAAEFPFSGLRYSSYSWEILNHSRFGRFFQGLGNFSARWGSKNYLILLLVEVRIVTTVSSLWKGMKAIVSSTFQTADAIRIIITVAFR